MLRLSQSLMNIMNMLSVSCLRQFSFTRNRTKVQSVRRPYLADVKLYKRKAALFPGNKNNWCVYTINGREQSTFSGEIWTPLHYHLLPPSSCAFKKELYDWFHMFFVFSYSLSYVIHLYVFVFVCSTIWSHSGALRCFFVLVDLLHEVAYWKFELGAGVICFVCNIGDSRIKKAKFIWFI